jgi:2-desacetyl-2-hydroxyethyl bacteriochlorophyllide A dehydrogenase
MRTAVFEAPGEIAVRDAPDPEPGPRELVVRVRAAGICGSDLHEYRARRQLYEVPYPRVAQGHEFAGEVVAVGPEVDDLATGDRVAVQPMIGCGACRWCAAGRFSLCPRLEHLGFARPGGFAELCALPRANAYALPSGVALDEAALLDCVAVGVHALHRVAPGPDARVAVLGAGPMGLACAAVALATGARDVTVVGRREASLAAARAVGAGTVLHVDDDACRTLEADVVLETAGGTDALERAIGVADRGATIGLVGEAFGRVPFDHQRVLERELTVAACWSYDTWDGASEFAAALELVAAGRVRLAPAITHRFGLDAIGEAFATADDRAASGAVKVLVEP